MNVCGLGPTIRSVISGWADGLPTNPGAGDDGASTMVLPSARQGRSIQERYELEVTRVGLGLVEAQESFPVGREERFYIEKLLGHGNMGAVYLARDRTLDRPVALKVVAGRLNPEHAKRRLEQEARALARLQHPNVVSIYDLATTEQGELFIAMEYVQGMTLRAWQRDRSLSEVLDAYVMAGEGLAAAHAVGCIHRDFKPDNVMVEAAEGALRVKVADFGIAGLGPEPSDATADGSLESGGGLTSPQGLLGTAAYMAPEQLRREQASAKSDQHQFCVALWEAMAGSRPFSVDGREPDEDTGLPKRPRAIPSDVHRVLVRGLAFEQRERFEVMDDLLRRLRRVRVWRRVRPWLMASAGLGVLVTSALLLKPMDDPCEAELARMSAIWNDDVREDLEESFAGSALELDYVTSGLDDLAEKWKTRVRESCSGGEAFAEACSEEWLDGMSRQIRILRGLDSTKTDGAHKLIDYLEEQFSNDVCARPIDLAAQEIIDNATTQELLGDLESALIEVSKVLELAASGPPERWKLCGEFSDGGPWSLELAAAQFRRGDILAELGRSEEAYEALRESYLNAYSCGDKLREAETRIRAAALLATDLGDTDAAQESLEVARVALQSNGREPGFLLYEQWKAAGLIAQHMAQKAQDPTSAEEHYSRAITYYERGLAVLDALGKSDENPIRVAKLIANIGTIHHGRENFAAAEKSYRKATELVIGALGRQHPQSVARLEHDALNLGILAADLVAGDPAKVREARKHLGIAAKSDELLIAIQALDRHAQLEFALSENDANPSDRAIILAKMIDARLEPNSPLPDTFVISALTTSGYILANAQNVRGPALLDLALTRARTLSDPTMANRIQIIIKDFELNRTTSH